MTKILNCLRKMKFELSITASEEIDKKSIKQSQKSFIIYCINFSGFYYFVNEYGWRANVFKFDSEQDNRKCDKRPSRNQTEHQWS